MPYQKLGSTGVLKAMQGQDDIWLNPGDPRAPVAGDEKLVVQSTGPNAAFIYVEVWSAVLNTWMVTGMPANIQVINDAINPGAYQVAVPLALPLLANQMVLGVATGFLFPWNTTFHINVAAGGNLWYIKHQKRPEGQLRLTPQLDFTVPLPITTLDWGPQMSQWRARHY